MANSTSEAPDQQRDYTAVIFELAWILPSFALPVAMFVTLTLTAYLGGIHLPSHASYLQPAAVAQTPPFNSPGIRQVAPGQYEAVLVGKVWSWTPQELRVPRNSTVTFLIASQDVTHGLFIPGTTVNTMILPGQVARISQRFDQPGEYLMLCHEYCGTGHHLMAGKIVVER